MTKSTAIPKSEPAKAAEAKPDVRYTMLMKPSQVEDAELLQRFFQRSTKADVMALGVFVLKWMAGEIASGRPVGSLYPTGLFREALIPHDSIQDYPELMASAALLSAAYAVPQASRAPAKPSTPKSKSPIPTGDKAYESNETHTPTTGAKRSNKRPKAGE